MHRKHSAFNTNTFSEPHETAWHPGILLARPLKLQYVCTVCNYWNTAFSPRAYRVAPCTQTVHRRSKHRTTMPYDFQRLLTPTSGVTVPRSPPCTQHSPPAKYTTATTNYLLLMDARPPPTLVARREETPPPLIRNRFNLAACCGVIPGTAAWNSRAELPKNEWETNRGR